MTRQASRLRQTTPPPAPSAAAVPSRTTLDQLLVAGFIVWTFLGLCFPLVDTDFWWHLKTGDLILADGNLPQVDWYTFTDSDKPWIDLHWGFQVLLALLYRVGGVPFVTLVKATVFTGAVVVGWSATGKNLPVWLRVAVWIPAVISITGRGNERPEMLSLLFLALWLWILCRVEQQPKLIWWLPAIQLVWVNCHALFVLGLVVGGCYLVDALVREFAQGRWGLFPTSLRPSSQWMIRAGALAVAACFANPYFEEGVLFPLELYRKFSVDQEFYSVRINEFQQPLGFVMQYGWRGVSNPFLIAEVLVFCLTAASFVWLLAARRFSVFRALLFAGFSHLAWEAGRNANIFSIVAGVVLCANLQDVRSLRPEFASPRDRFEKLRWGTAAALLGMILAIVSGAWNMLEGGHRPFRLGEAPAWFIHDAARFAGQPGFPEHAFVSNNGQAATYIYHNGPRRRVFMDARLEVCTMRTFQLFEDILHAMSLGNRAWEELLTDDGGNLPVVILDSRYSRDAITGMLNTPGWRLVFADLTAGVFLDDKTADKLGLPAVDHSPLD